MAAAFDSSTLLHTLQDQIELDSSPFTAADTELEERYNTGNQTYMATMASGITDDSDSWGFFDTHDTPKFRLLANRIAAVGQNGVMQSLSACASSSGTGYSFNYLANYGAGSEIALDVDDTTGDIQHFAFVSAGNEGPASEYNVAVFTNSTDGDLHLEMTGQSTINPWRPDLQLLDLIQNTQSDDLVPQTTWQWLTGAHTNSFVVADEADDGSENVTLADDLVNGDYGDYVCHQLYGFPTSSGGNFSYNTMLQDSVDSGTAVLLDIDPNGEIQHVAFIYPDDSQCSTSQEVTEYTVEYPVTPTDKPAHLQLINQVSSGCGYDTITSWQHDQNMTGRIMN